MPLFYQQDINLTTRLGIWKIEEEADFFLRSVPLQREIAHPHKRLQHLAGRFLLPFLFPDFPYSEILIADTRKPFLQDEQYHFSISHCGDYAAAIVSATDRVGIDIEIITPRVDKIKHKFLHPDELNFVKSYPLEKQICLLTLLWSCKEAMFKWWGRGDVDFSEVMRVLPFEMNLAGEMNAVFAKDSFHGSLLLHYQLTETTSLVWLTTQ